MTDLVADLRSYRVHANTESSVRDMVWKMGKAADEIERLTREVDRLGSLAESCADDAIRYLKQLNQK